MLPAEGVTTNGTGQALVDDLIPGAAAGNVSDSDIMSSLAGLDLSSSAVNKPIPASSNTTGISNSFFNTVAKPPDFESSPQIERWFERLTYNTEGVLFEDVQLQVGLKSEYHGHLGRLAIYFGNKMSHPLTSFTATVEGVDSNTLSVTFAKTPQTTIPASTQTQQLLHVECKAFFDTLPILAVSFVAGSLQTHRIRLPVVISRFVEPVTLGQADFFERWKIIGGPPREAQVVFAIKLDSSGYVDTPRQTKVITGTRFAVLKDVDPNSTNIVAAGVLHMSTEGKVGCLIRVEPNREAKLCRLTVRSTSETVAQEVCKLLRGPLSGTSS
jgi:AP-2 complex subunit alpha